MNSGNLSGKFLVDRGLYRLSRVLSGVLSGVLLAIGAAASWAQSVAPASASASAPAWPTKTIRAIVPFSIGSTVDIIGRIVMEPLSAQLGQQILVENRGGAGGTIGTLQVAQAEPDGYTLLIHASAHSAAPASYPKLSYDTAGDFAGIAVFGNVPNVTVISPAKGIRRLRDLVDRRAHV